VPPDALARLEIEGFTSIRSAAVDVGRLNVLVGANGAGKSNLIRALELLGRVVDEDLRLHVARVLINAAMSEPRIRLSLRGMSDFGALRAETGYDATLMPGPEEGLFFVEEGISQGISIQGGTAAGGEAPWTTVLDQGHRETRLHLTIEAGGRGAAVAAAVVDLLRGCRVYHFHDTSSDAPVKRPVSTADNLALRPDAANLAAVLLRLRDSDVPGDAAAYRRIVGSVRQVAPFFRDFVLQAEKNDRVRLRWRERDSDAVFSAHQMSDGTLRFVCLAALLLQPKLPALVVLDEPELGLHPYAIVQLAGLLRQAAHRSQVMIATQSVTLMNQFELADLIVVERGEHGSTFVRPDPERLEAWLEEYSLGELWEKNLLGGRPGSVSGLADGE
jgi:predicted ATPase